MVLLGGHPKVKHAHREELLEIISINLHRSTFFLQEEHLHGLAADLTDLTLESAHTCFTGVVTNDVADCTLFNTQLIGLKTIIFDLLRNQIVHCDAEFLILGVARKTNDLHAIQ